MCVCVCVCVCELLESNIITKDLQFPRYDTSMTKVVCGLPTIIYKAWANRSDYEIYISYLFVGDLVQIQIIRKRLGVKNYRYCFCCKWIID